VRERFLWAVLAGHGVLHRPGRSVARLLRLPCVEEERTMYSILYIIGAIVVIIVVLKVLGLY
jgi:hypothetical protein